MRPCSKRPAGSFRSATRPSWSYAARRATTARTPTTPSVGPPAAAARSCASACIRLAPRLQFKRWEGQLRHGRSIRAAAVTAEVATLTDIGGVPRDEGSWLVTDWVDVENWSTTIIHFEDGSRGVFIASDNILGGIVNYLELTLAHGRIKCNMTPNNMCEAYAADGTVWGDEYITEKIQTSAGWTYPSPDEDWVRVASRTSWPISSPRRGTTARRCPMASWAATVSK